MKTRRVIVKRQMPFAEIGTIWYLSDGGNLHINVGRCCHEIISINLSKDAINKWVADGWLQLK